MNDSHRGMTPHFAGRVLRGLRLGAPFAPTIEMTVDVDAKEFSAKKDWHTELPCVATARWRTGAGLVTLNRKFSLSLLAATHDSVRAFGRAQMRLLLQQVVRTAELTWEDR